MWCSLQQNHQSPARIGAKPPAASVRFVTPTIAFAGLQCAYALCCIAATINHRGHLEFPCPIHNISLSIEGP
jgi:hypothetical protein